MALCGRGQLQFFGVPVPEVFTVFFGADACLLRGHYAFRAGILGVQRGHFLVLVIVGLSKVAVSAKC